MPIYYHEIEVGMRRADFVVKDVILVEIKAITKLDDVIYAQILNYLRAYKFTLDFVPKRDRAYVLQVTCHCPDGRRLIGDIVLKY